MAGPRLLVDPPAFTPLPYGLLSVAQGRTPAGTPHWQNGVTYQTNCLGTNTTYDECIAVTGTDSPPEPETKVPEDNDLYITRGATPFTVYAKFECSPVGTDVEQLAIEALARNEGWQVEEAFWVGQAAGVDVVWPHLAADTVVNDSDGYLLQSAAVTGTGDVALALGFVEQTLSDCYPGQGVIHIPRSAIPTFDAWGLLKVVRGQLQTLSGNLVVAGGGYAGTAPDGSDPADGTTWIYATGAVFEMHGGVRITQMPDSFDRSENTMMYIAERTYLFGWDCCHAGALVTLGVPVP